MGMPAQHTEWTAELVRALPEDGRRHEVLDGALLVSPAPSWDHQRVTKELVVVLDAWLRRTGLGEVMISPADVEFSPRRLLQPDLFVVPAAERRPRGWQDVKALLLAVEVVSPATARADRGAKRIIYQDEQVPEYWVVDLDARLVERWRPTEQRPEIITGTLRWDPRPGTSPLEIDLPELFARALD